MSLRKADQMVGPTLHRLADILEAYLREGADPLSLVVDYRPATVLEQILNLSIPKNGRSIDEVLTDIDMYLRWSVRTMHPRYFNQLWGGCTLPGLIGEMIAAAANTSMYTYEVAPVAVLLERILIGKLGLLVGFANPDGQFVTGGSHANLLGMMIARNRTLPGIKENGSSDLQRLTAYVSDQAHYSFEKAANVLGLGTRNVIKVASDNDGRMQPHALEAAIHKSRSDNCIPFFVAGVAGTTVKGAFDPLREIAEIAKRQQLWFHVDGAWGAGALLSSRHRHLLDGCELADSFSWNAHKMMGVPLTCSAFLTRERGQMMSAFSNASSEYIFHDGEDASCDPGPASLQCGRRADVIKLWLSWQRFGDCGYEERLDSFMELAARATARIKRENRLELLMEPPYLNVCFRYVPEHHREIDECNRQIRDSLYKNGQSMVNYSTIGGRIWIRLACCNVETTPVDLDIFFDQLLMAGASLSTCL